jgi:ribosomal protein S18 acetylase RimI-like enzyme
MDPEVIIRPARPEDLEAIGRLGAALVRLHHDFDPARFIPAAPEAARGYARFLGSQIGAEEAVVLVAEREGAVVGYSYAGLEEMSWMELRGPAGFIHDVVVAEGARGHGIGGDLIEAAASWLEEHGAPRIMLWTAEKNTPGRHLFERLGFRRTMVEMTRERKDGQPPATTASS